MADRQIAASGIAYDGHQNQVLHDGDTYRYDQTDRHLATLVAGVRQVTLARDALDRIVARTDTDLATNTASTTRYGFAGGVDAVSAVYDTANNLIETTVALPAGVLYTKRAGGTDVWSYPNTHGDVAATRVNGTVTAFNWDPYGNPVGNIPDNRAGSNDWGWLGQHQRTLDHPGGLNPVIEMGTRVYQPDTGRFQQTDPIEDGTTTNPYSYVPDPINQYDLDGQWCMLGTIKTVGPDGKTHKKCRGRGVAHTALKATSAASGIVAVAAIFVPGGQTVAAVAAGISFGTSVLAEAVSSKPGRRQRVLVESSFGLLSSIFGASVGEAGWTAASVLADDAARHFSPTKLVSC